jgi:hypothetical protein
MTRHSSKRLRSSAKRENKWQEAETIQGRNKHGMSKLRSLETTALLYHWPFCVYTRNVSTTKLFCSNEIFQPTRIVPSGGSVANGGEHSPRHLRDQRMSPQWVHNSHHLHHKDSSWWCNFLELPKCILLQYLGCSPPFGFERTPSL